MLMKVFERYFSRNPVSRQLSFEADTAVIVIIPVFNDPDIFATLDSLCCCSVMNINYYIYDGVPSLRLRQLRGRLRRHAVLR